MSWDKETKFEYDWPLPLGQAAKIQVPPKPNWQWCFNGDWFAMTFNIYMKKGPSRLNRFLQKHLLGIHWRRI